MTIPGLITNILAYCPSSPEVDSGLILDALNSVRKEAEQLRDFELSKKFVTLTVDNLAGEDMSEAVIQGTEDAAMIKSVISVGFLVNGKVFPTTFTGLKQQLDENRRQLDRSVFDSEIRYPSDATVTSSMKESGVVQNGGSLFVYPFGTAGQTTDLSLNCYTWLPDYEDEEDEDVIDFFLQYCHNYLKWAAIVEINHLTKTFVPRIEGNLSPPNQRMERAWAAVEKWDDYLIETGRTIE